MRRRNLLILIAVGAVLFVVISGLLARAFSADGVERSAITSLIEAQAHGDQGAMLNEIAGCRQSVACQARVAHDAVALKRPGTVSIIQLQASAGSFSLTGSEGTARVAWNAGSSLPIVQCVRVRRAGNVLRGFHVQLLEISQRIKSDTACPARY